MDPHLTVCVPVFRVAVNAVADNVVEPRVVKVVVAEVAVVGDHHDLIPCFGSDDCEISGYQHGPVIGTWF